MQRVQEHLHAHAWYEALMCTNSALDKHLRRGEPLEALALGCEVIRRLAAEGCPNGDEYRVLMTRVATALAKVGPGDVDRVPELLREAFQGLALASSLTNCETFAVAVSEWYVRHGLNPAVCSWVSPYLPEADRLPMAVKGCYPVPPLMQTPKMLCDYVLALLDAGNVKVATKALEYYRAHSTEHAEHEEVAKLAVEAFRKHSLKGLKLIRTKYKAILDETERSTLERLEFTVSSEQNDADELD
ncbi:hypothetical protein GMRT_14902 [Giardia muris]|uniref:Uncharacterized protein n=1 Tax=Giardia muris TaxID=5742 RepID=A0A4Z1SN42_GIAMU|nr:hypothetical protein GMRT_14902 [Giardia muris]|eukprot:TNJ27010.1 hypothetical protein GMRT_14902 [Giardia muris]